MSVPFNWMWRDPAETLDRLRAVRDRMEKEDKEFREREIKRNRKRIRKLLKQAQRRELKGQR